MTAIPGGAEKAGGMLAEGVFSLDRGPPVWCGSWQKLERLSVTVRWLGRLSSPKGWLSEMGMKKTAGVMIA